MLDSSLILVNGDLRLPDAGLAVKHAIFHFRLCLQSQTLERAGAASLRSIPKYRHPEILDFDFAC